jgi:hypothetical protein
MTDLDVAVDIDVAAPPSAIAAVMFDPHRDPDWIGAVSAVEVVDPALAPGARVRRRGQFLGREIEWTTAVESVHFPHALAMRITDGPFAGLVRYEIARTPDGSRVRIRNTGQLTALGPIPRALVEAPMRSALVSDLERLKHLVESGG